MSGDLVQYKTNLANFVQGFGLLSKMKFKKGWGVWWPMPFILVYIFNHGSRVLAGGANVTWSKWFYLNAETNRAAAFFNRLLNHLDADHGKEAGEPFPGSADCSPAFRILVSGFWLVLLRFAYLLVRG